eukprot:424317_1
MPPSKDIIQKFETLGYKHIPLKLNPKQQNNHHKNNNENNDNDDEKKVEKPKFDLGKIYTQFEKQGYFLHLKQHGNKELWNGAIEMRDYLRVNKNARDKYAAKKKQILEQSKNETVAVKEYTMKKMEMVLALLNEAKEWKLTQQTK